MAKYNFDEIINRKNTNSLKWNATPDGDITPMWIADFDFQVAPPILKALTDKVNHGIFGYSMATDSYFESVINWFSANKNFDIKKEWICITPGIIPAIGYIIELFTKKGDNVLIQTPAYPPYFPSIDSNQRNVLTSRLICRDDYYEMDFDDLAHKIKKSNAFIFCNPHNPVGRVWKQQEIERVIELCLENNTLLVSDEIFSDLIFKGFKHNSLFNYLKDIGDNLIVCNSPSKSFNVPGFMLSNIFIPNDAMRYKFSNKLNNSGFRTQNIMGLIACEAAYKHCKPWIVELIKYLEENYNFLKKSLKSTNMKLTRSEGTFLTWIDCSQLGLDKDKIESLLMYKSKVMASMGYLFGEEFDKFIRINIGCPKSVLSKKVDDLKKYLK